MEVWHQTRWRKLCNAAVHRENFFTTITARTLEKRRRLGAGQVGADLSAGEFDSGALLLEARLRCNELWEHEERQPTYPRAL